MEALFYIAIFLLSADIMLTATNATFINKLNVKILAKLLFLPISIMGFIGLGLLIGKAILPQSEHVSYWYASTALFILSVKLTYSAFRLQQHKLSVNINDYRALLLIIFTLAVNSTLCGTAFGLLNIGYKLLIPTFIIALLVMIIGIITGLKIKNLFSVKYDLMSAIGFLCLAIIIIFNY